MEKHHNNGKYTPLINGTAKLQLAEIMIQIKQMRRQSRQMAIDAAKREETNKTCKLICEKMNEK